MHGLRLLMVVVLPAGRAVRARRVAARGPRVDGHAVDGGQAVAAAQARGAVHAVAAAAAAVVARRARGDAVGGVHGDERGRDGLDATAAQGVPEKYESGLIV